MTDPATSKSGSLRSAWELDHALERFERAWRSGPPGIAEFLAHPRLDRRALLMELLYVDLEQRLRRGYSIDVEVYFSQFPELAEDDNAAVELICYDFAQRQRLGLPVSSTDYLDRFPRWRRLLETRFHATANWSVERAHARLICPHCQCPFMGSDAQAAGAVECQICGSALRLADARFTISRHLGSGGMGVVYEALDHERNLKVALKVLPHGGAAALYRFKQEFRALADVAHPNIVPLYELIADGTHWFITMELIDGVDFLTYVRDRQPSHASEPEDSDSGTLGTTAPTMGAQAKAEPSATPSSVRMAAASQGFGRCDFDRLRSALRQLAAALSAIHGAGKLHRDLKPSNVLVRPDGLVAVLDFGLATGLREWNATPIVAHDDSWSVEQTDLAVVGTVAFMSPEQAAGKALTEASDWYSVGVMLFLSLTGQLPIAGPAAAVLRDKQTHDPPAPSEITSGIPTDLNDLCLRLLRRDPTERPTCAQVLELLSDRTGGNAVGDKATNQEIPTLVGRAPELGLLREAFADMLQGHTVVVHVQGRSGMGKSLLLARLLHEMNEVSDTVILVGRCYEQESVPFKALDSLVDALSHYLAGLSREKLDAIMPRDFAALSRVFPVLQRVPFVMELAASSFQVNDLQELRRRAFAAIRELLARLGSRRPLVLAIDDLQWGDVEGATRLVELVQPPDAPRVLLLLLYRTETFEHNACLQALRPLQNKAANFRNTVLRVDPLSEKMARELARALLGAVLPETGDLAAQIAAASQGNPFFINELVRNVVGGGWTQRSTPEGVDLEMVLWSRIEQLPSDCKRLLEVIAIADQPLCLRNAYEAAGLATRDHQLVMTLRAAGLLRSDGLALDATCDTFHDRVRECIRGKLPIDVRREYHAQLAYSLARHRSADPETIGVHYQASGQAARAAFYYRLAAESADRSLAFARAVKLYRLSLELDPQSAANGRELKTQLADALANAGLGVQAAEAYLAAALEAQGAQKIELERRAAYQYCISGLIEDGSRVLNQSLQHFGMRLYHSRLNVLARLLGERVWSALHPGLSFRVRAPAEIASALLERVDVTWETSIALTMIDTLQGALFQARNLRLALAAGDPMRLARSVCWQATHLSTRGQHTRTSVTRLFACADELRKTVSSDYLDALAELAGGIVAYFLGEWRKSTCQCESAAKIFRERCRHVSWEVNTAQAFWLWSLVFQGELKTLGGELPRLLDEAKSRGDLLSESNLANFAGPHVWLARDEPERAAEIVHGAMQMWPAGVFHVQHFTSLAGLTQIELYADHVEKAYQRIESNWGQMQRSLFLEIEAIRVFMRHLRGRCGLARAARAHRRTPLLRRVARDARRLERETAPWAKPMALSLRSGIARLEGRQEVALATLSQAIEGFTRSGMQLYAMCGRRARGAFAHGAEGYRDVETAEVWMQSQGISNPKAMTALHCPGLESS